MDPVTLAATVTTLLAPYLAKAGRGAIKNIAKEMPETVSVLWDKISKKFQGRPAAEGAALGFASKADDEINQQTFKLQLQKALESDSTFAQEFEALFKKAQASVNINIEGSGAVSTHGGIAAGEGGIAIGGNVQGNIIMGDNNAIDRTLKRLPGDSTTDAPPPKKKGKRRL